ncbi:MAG: arginine repressor [Clostridiales bacterium]|jgi:transcriptional regulator of arginine metabolism|nr:arginine repressor [Clostridiales bacterium]
MKYNRQAKILEIIEKECVETQEELSELLKESGMDVTQATVSRDIKELKLVKITTSEGKSRYSSINENVSAVTNKLLTIFTQAYVSSDYANNITVVKTLSGMAQAVASAVDSMKWPEVLGTIGGDDTILIVCRAEKFAEDLTDRFERMVR